MEKQDFYLTKRKLKSGTSVYYYYYYDKFGNRTVPKTTGCKKKQDAFNFCLALLRKNNLSQQKMKFKYFALDFFGDNSTWYKNKVLSGNLKPGTVKGYRSYFNNQIFDYFAEMYLDKITPVDILEYRFYLSNEKELSNKTINNIIGVVRIVFDWAVEEGLIYKSPITKMISKLKEDKKREAFTKEELKLLLCKKWKNKEAWLFTLTCAITGMRFSEINGLTINNLHKGYIDINQQIYDGQLQSTKTDENRFITIPDKLYELLIEQSNGSEFIFTSPEDTSKPVSRSYIVRAFNEEYPTHMLKARQDRLLTFHAMRYFMNTYLLANNVSKTKVNFVIGHNEEETPMQRLYTTWKPEMYSEILSLQEPLLDEFLQGCMA